MNRYELIKARQEKNKPLKRAARGHRLTARRARRLSRDHSLEAVIEQSYGGAILQARWIAHEVATDAAMQAMTGVKIMLALAFALGAGLAVAVLLNV